MAKQTLDLYELFRLVISKGGLVEVINKKLWREITKGLNLPSSITSAAFTLRTQWVIGLWFCFFGLRQFLSVVILAVVMVTKSNLARTSGIHKRRTINKCHFRNNHFADASRTIRLTSDVRESKLKNYKNQKLNPQKCINHRNYNP